MQPKTYFKAVTVSNVRLSPSDKRNCHPECHHLESSLPDDKVCSLFLTSKNQPRILFFEEDGSVHRCQKCVESVMTYDVIKDMYDE